MFEDIDTAIYVFDSQIIVFKYLKAYYSHKMCSVSYIKKKNFFVYVSQINIWHTQCMVIFLVRFINCQGDIRIV